MQELLLGSPNIVKDQKDGYLPGDVVKIFSNNTETLKDAMDNLIFSIMARNKWFTGLSTPYRIIFSSTERTLVELRQMIIDRLPNDYPATSEGMVKWAEDNNVDISVCTNKFSAQFDFQRFLGTIKVAPDVFIVDWNVPDFVMANFKGNAPGTVMFVGTLIVDEDDEEDGGSYCYIKRDLREIEILDSEADKV